MRIVEKLIDMANVVARRGGYEIRVIPRPKYYIDASETVRAARERGQSVCEYVEELWGQQGCTDRVIQEIGQTGALRPCDRVCEIGPGTGRYLERVLKHVNPKQYDIYEVAEDWAGWLASTYSPVVVRQPASGHALAATPDASCGFVHAHGVFVSLSLFHTFEYLNEMMRVCAPGGYVAFDFYAEEYLEADTIDRWLAEPHSYTVIVPDKIVKKLFENRNFKFLHEFKNKHGHGHSLYTVFQKA